MKIIAGVHKGMPIKCSKGLNTRPTSARIREAVMSMVSDKLHNSVFFDLFSGSGAMGLEALSRGAKSVLFVENGKEAIKVLQKNCAEIERRFNRLEMACGKIKLIPKELSSSLKTIEYSENADIIWADPPYSITKDWTQSIFVSKLSNLINENGVFLLEAASSDLAQIHLDQKYWEKVKDRKYGSTSVGIWRRNHFREE